MQRFVSDRFSVRKVREEPSWRYFHIEESQHGQLVRWFIGRITRTQATGPQVESEIARWCQINSGKLPKAAGTTIDVDLSNVPLEGENSGK